LLFCCACLIHVELPTSYHLHRTSASFVLAESVRNACLSVTATIPNRERGQPIV
jgi:hypothetical protein